MPKFRIPANSTRREYADGALYVANGPFAGEMRAAEGVLCPDGIRRSAFPSADGIADTFFSIPAYVHAKGRRVYGYVTVDKNEHGAEELRFVPYASRKYADLVEHPRRADDDTCIHCGRETVARNGRGTLPHRVHVDDASFLCDVDAYRDRDERGYLKNERGSWNAEVRDAQRYRLRTEDERA